MDDFLYRSWLCSSVLQHDLTRETCSYKADIMHLDFEDSVAVMNKGKARKASVSFLNKNHNNFYPLAIRINALTSIEGVKDLLFFVENKMLPDILILPKVESNRDIEILNEVLSPIMNRKLRVFAVIETLKGLKKVNEIAYNKQHVLSGLIFGKADMVADMAISFNSAIFNHVKSEIALAAIANGLVAIDSPCFSLSDTDILEYEILEARELGFSGKIAVHPNQVEKINLLFSLDAEQVEEAGKIISSFCRDGDAIKVINDKMMGPPFLKMAHKIIEKNKAKNKNDKGPAVKAENGWTKRVKNS